jgi:pyridoxine 4-dehydrogenase
MTVKTLPGGTFTVSEDLTVTRVGYGAMQLAGPGVFGPARDRDAAIAVLREAMELGITHIDTSDYYGPHITSTVCAEQIAEAQSIAPIVCVQNGYNVATETTTT